MRLAEDPPSFWAFFERTDETLRELGKSGDHSLLLSAAQVFPAGNPSPRIQNIN